MSCKFFILPLYLLILNFFAHPIRFSYAESNPDNTVSLRADSLSYSQEDDIFFAQGNALLLYKNKTLTAGRVTFFKQDKIIIASEGVELRDEQDAIYNFDYLKIDMKTQEVSSINLRAVTRDNIFWSAKKFELHDRYHSTANGFTFSPCELCDGKRLWQVHAQEIEINEHTEKLTIKKATIDILNKPMFNIRYFSIPSPRATAKNGFLTPSLSLSDDMGFRIETPYYIRIKPNMDLTIAPIFGLKSPTMYTAEYRHLLSVGDYKIRGSFTPENTANNAKEADGDFEIKGNFRYQTKNSGTINYGINAHKLFDRDKTYLKKYKISEEDILSSHLYVSRQNFDKNKSSKFISLEMLTFQDLRPEYDDSLTPNALPIVRYVESRPIFDKMQLNTHSVAYNVFTKSHDDDHRFMNDTNVSGRFITDSGYEITLKNGIYTYLHSYNHLNAITKNSVNQLNFMPYSQLRVGYELLAQDYKDRITIEPVASLMLTNNKFFAQDAELLEMRKSNFFSHNRFLDWESSDLMSRFDYGVNLRFTNNMISDLSCFVGNSIYLTENKNLIKNYKFNYVTNTSLRINRNTFINNRMWIDQSDFKILQHEIDSIIQFEKVNVGMHYTYKRQSDAVVFPQEISSSLDLNFYKKWWIRFNLTLKLNNAKSALTSDEIYDSMHVLQNGVGLTYLDDCLRVDFYVNRDHTKMRNLSPSTTYVIKMGIPIFDKL